MRVACCGAGGAIGGALVARLVADGHIVVASDIKPLDAWWRVSTSKRVTNLPDHDLTQYMKAMRAVDECEWVFDLSDVMGGIGHIESHRVDCAESIEIGISLLRAASRSDVQRFFYSSSACAYRTDIQQDTDAVGLVESDAWPARPEQGYGLQKLYMEELCRHYSEEVGLETRVARYHNVYTEHSSWNDGREKSPSAICRKVAEAKLTDSGKIEIWGDGQATRSYLHVSDCIEGTLRLMGSDYPHPVNIGSDRLVSINELVSMVEQIAGVELERTYDLSAPQGVRGRNADLTLCREVLGWEPSVALEDGLAELYRWIERQVKATLH